MAEEVVGWIPDPLRRILHHGDSSEALTLNGRGIVHSLLVEDAGFAESDRPEDDPSHPVETLEVGAAIRRLLEIAKAKNAHLLASTSEVHGDPAHDTGSSRETPLDPEAAERTFP